MRTDDIMDLVDMLFFAAILECSEDIPKIRKSILAAVDVLVAKNEELALNVGSWKQTVNTKNQKIASLEKEIIRLKKKLSKIPSDLPDGFKYE